MIDFQQPPVDPSFVQSAPIEHKTSVESYQALVSKELSALQTKLFANTTQSSSTPSPSPSTKYTLTDICSLLPLTCPFNPYVNKSITTNACKVLLYVLTSSSELESQKPTRSELEQIEHQFNSSDLFPPEYLKPFGYLTNTKETLISVSSNETTPTQTTATNQSTPFSVLTKALLTERLGEWIDQFITEHKEDVLMEYINSKMKLWKDQEFNIRFILVQLVLVMKVRRRNIIDIVYC